MPEAHTRDKRYIEELERELRNCSLEIEYLQDQLNLRNVESSFIGEHVHSLELKLAEAGTLHEKLRLLSEVLMQSESRRLNLTQEIKKKENELHGCALQIKELEMAISTLALESQCEIESMKLDITALEERCFETERFSQQAAEEKDEMDLLLEMSESQFKNAQVRINSLEMENKDLKQQVVAYEKNVYELYHKVVERLDTWLKHKSKMKEQGSGSFWDLLIELKTAVSSLKEKCTSEELHRPFVSNPGNVAALNDSAKEAMEKMTNQIHEFELVIRQLKEDLRTEKLKANEEAEDLTQEMAELRYQMTNMLEEECKHRASIEQTSLRRIQVLEEQVRKEQNQCLTTMRRLQEVHKLAEMRDDEIKHLKNVLKVFRKITDPETTRKIESFECSTKARESMDDSCNDNTSHQALLGWYSDGKSPLPESEYIQRA